MFDLFWKDDISILYNVDRLTEFFPSSDMNFDEKLNALVRLCTYAGVLLYLYHKNKDYLYLPIVMMGASLFLNKMSTYERNEHFEIIKKNVDPKKFTLPTVNNPIMNYNVMSNNTNKKPAADIESVQQDIKNKFDEEFACTALAGTAAHLQQVISQAFRQLAPESFRITLSSRESALRIITNLNYHLDYDLQFRDHP